MLRSVPLISVPRVLSRLAQGLLVVFISASVAFGLMRSVKGDEFSHLLDNTNATAAVIASLRDDAGHNTPILQQYGSWMSHVVRGDLLTSKAYRGQTVVSLIGAVLPNTLLLMSLAFFSSLALGIGFGVWQGVNTDSRSDRIASSITLGIISMPDFWVAMILILLLALHWPRLPTGGMSSTDVVGFSWQTLHDRTRHLVLPWLSLTLINAAAFARYQRAAMRDVVGLQFLRTARAKGVPESVVISNHALRVAVLPLVTIAGMFFPALLVGTILIEKVFSWPGMSALLTLAVNKRDYPLVSGIIIVGSAMTALGSFLADVVRELLDPRLRR
ncbi:MAG: ABC transporter permease [Gemmatimonas sp.]